jgi:hypothetical protein
MSPPLEGVCITRQNTAFSISGFSIISSFRESLNARKCVGNEFVKAVAYNDVKSALCLSVNDNHYWGILLKILSFVNR